MPTSRTCAKCGAVLKAESALDVCPQCVAAHILTPTATQKSGSAALASVTEQPGDRIGRYKLREKIGEGGCGVVYVAEQEEPVRRRVALKVIKLGMDTRDVIARFEAERQALAMMDHTNIAKVLDAGTTETGRPFFVMELVRGIRITDYCDENKLNTERRLDLFIQVCHAVQHAHQKGVIHRDLKPSNILVTINDGVPVPKVIDFGIAKATEGRLTDKTVYTQLHQFIGTPAYMSPEQAMMTSLDIDTRSDIYSLGVLLYELLTGRPPFDPRAMLAAGIDEVRRTIREQEPPRPSTRLSTLPQDALTNAAKRRSTEAPKLIHAISGDLDWIVMKCLEKDRTRRYDTANGLAADLKRHLNSEPINARPPSALYTFQKLVRRNRLAFAAAGGVSAAVLIGLAVSTALFLKERQTRRRAVTAEQSATAQAQRATRNAEESQERLLRHSARLLEEGDWMRSLPWFVEAFKADQSHPENEANHRLRLASIFQQCPRPVQMWFHAGSGTVALSPDGELALTGSSDGTTAIWDVRTGQQLALAQFPPDTSSRPRCRFSADGKSAFAEGGKASIIWDVGARSAAQVIPLDELIHTSAISPDGQFYALRCEKRPLLIWDKASGNLSDTLSKGLEKIDALTFLSPENARVVFGITGAVSNHVLLGAGRSGGVYVWDAATGRLLQKKRGENPHPALGLKSTFSPDGRLLAQPQAAEDNFRVLLRDVPGERLIATFKHDHHVLDIEFSPDGKTVVTSSQDRTARIWDTQTGLIRCAPLQHGNFVEAIDISPGGNLVVTASGDATARVWDLHTGQPVGPPLVHSAIVRDANFGANDSVVITSCDDGTVRIWDLAAAPKWQWVGDPPAVLLGLDPTDTGFGNPHWGAASHHKDGIVVLGVKDQQPRLVRLPAGGPVFFAAGSADGKRLLVGRAQDNRPQYQLWSTESRQPLGSAFTPGNLLVGDFDQPASLDVSRLVTINEDKARVWNTLSGQPVGLPVTLPQIKKETSIQITPDGTGIHLISKEQLHVWNVADGRERFPALRNLSTVKKVSFSADGQRLAAAFKDPSGIRYAQVFSAKTGQPIGPRLVHQEVIMSVALSQDGNRVVTAGDDHRARAWDAATGQLLAPEMDSPHALEMVAFGQDDRVVVGANEDGSTRIWDARTGEPLIAPLHHGAWIAVGSRYQRAMLLGGGRTLYTMMVQPRYWEMPTDARPLEEWERIAQLLSSRRVNERGWQEALDRISISNLWSTLQASARSHFSLSSARLYDWNIWRAETCMAEFNLAGALPHLNALVAVEPARVRFRWMRSRACEGLQLWQQMAEDLRVVSKLDPDDRRYRERLTAAELAAGNQSEYQAACAALAGSLPPGDDLDILWRTVEVCTYGPRLSSETAALLRHRIETLAALHSSSKRYIRSLARLRVREGRYAEAVVAFSKLIEADDLRVSDRLFLALAHHGLGDEQEAKKFLSQVKPYPRGWFSTMASDTPAVAKLFEMVRDEAESKVK